jgi:hypothetical protein
MSSTPRDVPTVGAKKTAIAWWTGRRCRSTTRLRSQENREQRLGSYELFQRSAPLEHGVWDKMMRGLSTRNYGAVVKEFREAYGVEKSAVSDNFMAASREKLHRVDGAAAGRVAAVRGADRRHASPCAENASSRKATSIYFERTNCPQTRTYRKSQPTERA